MALHEHQVRNDRLAEQFAAASLLGEKKIPAAMTLPLAQIKRALREASETFADALQMHQDQHSEGKWVEEPAGEGKPPKRRFVPDPVYQTEDDGTPKFKLDAKGNATTERLIAQGRVQLKNAVEHQREKREMDRATTTIKVPHISWPQLEGKVALLEGNITDALWDYFDDRPNPDAEKKPAEPAKKKAGAAT